MDISLSDESALRGHEASYRREPAWQDALDIVALAHFSSDTGEHNAGRSKHDWSSSPQDRSPPRDWGTRDGAGIGSPDDAEH